MPQFACLCVLFGAALCSGCAVVSSLHCVGVCVSQTGLHCVGVCVSQTSLHCVGVSGTAAGADLNLSLDKVNSNRNFTNKLWNAGKFILGSIQAVRVDHVLTTC